MIGRAIGRIGAKLGTISNRVTTTVSKGVGKQKSFSDRIGGIKDILRKNKGKVAAVAVTAGSLGAVAGSQKEEVFIDDTDEYIETNECDSYGNMNPFRDCVGQCPINDPNDPCIKNQGCYDKDINGEPIFKDIDLKKQCNEKLLRQTETSDYEKNFLEVNVPDDPDDNPNYPDVLDTMEDPDELLDKSLDEPIPIESETTLDNSDIVIPIKNEVDDTSKNLKQKIEKIKENALKNKTINQLKDINNEIKQDIEKSNSKSNSKSKSNGNSELYNKINEYMDPRILGIALLIIVWLIYQIFFK